MELSKAKAFSGGQRGLMLVNATKAILCMTGQQQFTVFKITSFARNARGDKKLIIAMKVAILGSSRG